MEGRLIVYLLVKLLFSYFVIMYILCMISFIGVFILLDFN